MGPTMRRRIRMLAMATGSLLTLQVLADDRGGWLGGLLGELHGPLMPLLAVAVFTLVALPGSGSRGR